jgi:hypothetical protein
VVVLCLIATAKFIHIPNEHQEPVHKSTEKAST